MFKTTIRFIGGILKGLEYTEIRSFESTVGKKVLKPIGGSPYIVIACERV